MRGAGLRTPPNLRIVKAMASPLRARILSLLARGPMTYTEIMRSLRLSPDRDAGKFAYHLKTLVKAGLVRPNSEDGKYEITDLGRIAYNVLEGLEERVSRRRKMVVRTSRLAIEEFDRSKIAESLVREAGVPVELATRIAREAEERLLMMRVKYLTAPLIREVVNAILLEKGLEEYRHRMTRVGMPVYDVSELLARRPSWTVREITCGKVMEEFALIGVLKRSVADAHLSGDMHIEGLRHWALGPTSVFHDLRPLLSGSLLPPWARGGREAPGDLREALQMVLALVSACLSEVGEEQVFPFFNIFLAPFARGLAEQEAEKALGEFLIGLSHLPGGPSGRITLGLWLGLPDYMRDAELVGPGGEKWACEELEEEERILAKALLSALGRTEVPNPSVGLVVHVDPRSTEPDDELLLAAHQLSVKNGLPIFANHSGPAAVAFDGSRHTADWAGDWELDLLRTGRAGRVVLNLPRLAYEADREPGLFLNKLKELLGKAVEASVQRRASLNERAEKKLMPVLMADVGGEGYLRLKSTSYPISFIGLPEACLALTGEGPHEGPDGLEVAKKILETVGSSLASFWGELDLRCPPSALSSHEAASRLARLDVERYGWSKVVVFGPRDRPCYTSGELTPEGAELDLEERLELEGILGAWAPGGQLLFIQPEEARMGPEELAELTIRALGYGICALAYPAELTYCSACNRAFRGSWPKCPSCGRVSTISRFIRRPEGYVREPGGGR